MHIIKHYLTITRHRHKVIHYCFKCGLYFQGLVHDLSKYGFTEFFNGAKFYEGVRSPHYNERMAKGFSESWMHHKGRNKHHFEYWNDYNLALKKYCSVDMPNRYLAESICDRIAASKNYNRKSFTPKFVLDYFLNSTDIGIMHPNTAKRMEYILRYYVENGEKKTFKYIKKYMRNKNTNIPMN